MSYVDKKNEEEKQEDKIENPLKAIFAEDTQIESPEDVIKTDTDEKRKSAFKKAYDRLQGLFPDMEEKKKKKKKEKEKEKEEFNRNLNTRGRTQAEPTRTTKKENRDIDNDRTKGIERD